MKYSYIFKKIIRTCLLSISLSVVLSGCKKDSFSYYEDPIIYPTAASVYCNFHFVGGHVYDDAGLLFDTNSASLVYGEAPAIKAYTPSQNKFTILGLKSNTTYYYRAYICEKDKDIQYGEVSSFSTPAAIDVAVENLVVGEQIVTATVSAGSPTDYNVSEIGIQYAPASDSIEQGQKKKADNNKLVSLTNLMAKTKYNCRAYAKVYYNGIGEDYIYGEVKSFVSPDIVIPTFTLTGSGSYPWSKYSSLGHNCLYSSNKGKNGTTSSSSLTINISKSSTLTFKYKVSSESKYDKLSIKLNDAYVANAISGTISNSYTTKLSVGSHIITLSYSKDNSTSSGDDRGYIYDIALDDVYISNSDIIER